MERQYGLRRGGQWVCPSPRRTRKKVRQGAGGPVLWMPGLRLGPREEAWLASTLELALERAEMVKRLNLWSAEVCAVTINEES